MYQVKTDKSRKQRNISEKTSLFNQIPKFH